MEPLVNWSPQETQALIAVWSDDRIQLDLQGSVRNENVFREVSEKLLALGMHRSAKQCRQKIKKLKQEYRKMKKDSDGGGARTTWWYEALDAVMREAPAMTHSTGQSAPATLDSTISETDSPIARDDESYSSSSLMSCTALTLAPRPAEYPQHPEFYSTHLGDDGPSTSTAVASTAGHLSVKDRPLCCWSNREVQALLTLWANPAVQEELHLNVRNNKVYTHLSASLASLGFNKAPKKCREKIKKLKQEYKRIKNGGNSNNGNSSRTSVWFAIMDDVLNSQNAPVAGPSPSSQSQFVVDEDSKEETQWLPDEVQVLITLWAQPNIQKHLLITEKSHQVFTYLSNELALVGFNKTPNQCYLKMNCLKEEYRKIKAMDPHVNVQSDWYTILDSVLCPTSTDVDSSAALTQTKSPQVNDDLSAVWPSDEVKVLLSQWAEESIQEQLRTTLRNKRVFPQLSSALATQGFDKTTSQCRSKIRLLKQKYERVRKQNDRKKQKSRWFTIMDKVLADPKPEVEAEHAAEVMDSSSAPPQTSHYDPSETTEEPGYHFSLSSLCLLVPTLRLMCAFAWQVVRCCNVAHYRKVEELVRLVTELAPELLTPREKVQLLLRLRARFVLELCRSGDTANLLNIQPHLQVIKDLTIDSSCDQEELENSKSNLVEVIHTLLEDPEQRNMFFTEPFHLHYGQQYQATLCTLVWKFISRLDALMPIPDVKQTAEWLSTAPSVMEQCGQLVLEPHQLKALMHFHEQQSGSRNQCDSWAHDVFLPRLSLSSKANVKPLVIKQQEILSAKTEDQWTEEEEEEEEPVMENQSDHRPTVEDSTEEYIGLNLKDDQSHNGSNTRTLLRHQTSSWCPYSDSQVLHHIRKEHQVQEPGPQDSRKDIVLQKVITDKCAPHMRSSTNTCEYCSRVFTSVSSLNKHTKTHTLPFQCNKCEKKYSTRESLNVHCRIHTGELPYLCSHCGRGFRSSYIFKSHVRIHTGERCYKCHICGKTSIQHLARHLRMHRGERNYLCTECGKAFLSSGELRLHMRLHTGERPYTCKHCGRGFIAKCLLTVHTRQHTGESPYRCPQCPKSFHTLKAQKRHVKIHSNKKSFQCLTCGKIFRQ